MTRSIRKLLARALLAGAAIGLAMVSGAAAQEPRPQALQKLKLGFGTKIVSPMIANILIPEYLGYYKQEGLTLEFFPLGPNTVVMEQIASKRIDFATGVPTVQLPVVAKGEPLPTMNFYEFTYPFKYGLATSPESKIQAFSDLKGKTLGVSSLGLTDYPIFRLILKRNGIDPDKDVSIIAVGEGVVGGQALKRGAIEALFSYDTQFGAVEAVGIPLRYLPLPKNVPHVGGFYLTTRRETLKEHRNWAVGIGRAVAKAQVFIRENPDAAAYAYLQMFPESAPKASTLDQQIAAIKNPIVKRQAFFSSYDPGVKKWGEMTAAEFKEEVEFLELADKIKDVSGLFTNELIDEINAFDPEKIKAEARSFKIPRS
jgi:NitT/TauT family transport system substrate-binding protein